MIFLPFGAFIIMRLWGIIDWSVWWIMSPIWIYALILMLALVIGFLTIKDDSFDRTGPFNTKRGK